MLQQAKQALKSKDLITATVLLTKAIEQDPDCCEAYILRSQLSMAFGDKAGAAEDMKRAIALRPELLQTLNGEFQNKSGCHDN